MKKLFASLFLLTVIFLFSYSSANALTFNWNNSGLTVGPGEWFTFQGNVFNDGPSAVTVTATSIGIQSPSYPGEFATSFGVSGYAGYWLNNTTIGAGESFDFIFGEARSFTIDDGNSYTTADGTYQFNNPSLYLTVDNTPNVRLRNSSFIVTVVSPNQIPEPGTLLLIGAGLSGLGIYRMRLKRK